jgi:putative hydrolase of HD superfamily
MGGLLELLLKVGKLKELPRTGWVEQGIEDPESVADHSYRTAVLSMLFADLVGLDSETLTGDLTPVMKRQRGVGYQIEERDAVKLLLSALPREVALEYKVLWDELQIGSTPEAKIVVQADKVEMKIQALEYELKGIDPTRLGRFWHSNAFDGLALDLFQEIRKKREKNTVQT